MIKSKRLSSVPRRISFPTLLAGVGTAAFMIMMLLRPDFYLNSARRGLSLYATSVLPSLFPFYFCSLLLTSIGAAGTMSKIFQKPMRALYNVPKESGYVMLLSMLSGYPVGASTLEQLYSCGVIDAKDVKAISAFASTSGPIFMLGTVGIAAFGDVRAGAIILASHYLAAFLNGFIYRRKKRGGSSSPALTLGVDGALSKTISSSTLAMLSVGGFIVICGMLVDTLTLFDIDELLAPLPSDAAASIKALAFGAIEMTRGCIAAAEAGNFGIAISAAIISMGGLSITLQNYAFLSKCGMRLSDVLLRKFTHALIAFAIALSLSLIIS